MGRPKQLLPLQGKPVIRHCLDTVLKAGIGQVIVVLGYKGEEIANAITDLPVATVFNRAPQSDMAASVRVGLRALSRDPSGILVCLSDHPLVQAATLRTLARRHRSHPDNIIIPEHRGKRGHPTLFPAAVINEVFSGATLRDLQRRNPSSVSVITVDDPGVVLDMDTMEDYRKIRIAAGETAG